MDARLGLEERSGAKGERGAGVPLSFFPHEAPMKPRLLLLAPIAAAAPAVAASGQGVRPESLSYMSRVFTLKDFGIPDNPRYSRDGKWLAFDAPKTGATG